MCTIGICALWEDTLIEDPVYLFPQLYDLEAVGEKKSGVAAFARVYINSKYIPKEDGDDGGV